MSKRESLKGVKSCCTTATGRAKWENGRETALQPPGSVQKEGKKYSRCRAEVLCSPGEVYGGAGCPHGDLYWNSMVLKDESCGMDPYWSSTWRVAAFEKSGSTASCGSNLTCSRGQSDHGGVAETMHYGLTAASVLSLRWSGDEVEESGWGGRWF